MDYKKKVKKQLTEFYDNIYEGKNTLGFKAEANTYAERIVKLFAIHVAACCCPKCGAHEVDAMTPRTIYKCGSSDYDQRPNTFKQTIKCRIYATFNWR
jgi:hypothetical protein